MKKQWDPARLHIYNNGSKTVHNFTDLKGKKKRKRKISYIQQKIVIIYEGEQETLGNPTAH